LENIGTIYVVATPIGNLQDLSLRALEVLKKVDVIAAEDTRHSAILLQHYGISGKILSLHDFNERQRSAELLARVQAGQALALISDAGTPLISDPGYYLINQAWQLGVKVVPVPGCCAAIAALSVAGIATDKFVFEGFLPAKEGQRRQRIAELKFEARTIVLYESKHRILSCLADLIADLGGDRMVVVARELTKCYETILRGTLSEILSCLQRSQENIKGEFVVIIAGKVVKNVCEQERVLSLLLAELPLKQAVKLSCQISGERKNEAYARALAQIDKDGKP